MFFQLSIDKNGVVSGAYQNVSSGEKSPISGQLDKKTQRVAWKIGTNNTVIETGLQNLSHDVATCLVHFGPDKTETWLRRDSNRCLPILRAAPRRSGRHCTPKTQPNRQLVESISLRPNAILPRVPRIRPLLAVQVFSVVAFSLPGRRLDS